MKKFLLCFASFIILFGLFTAEINCDTRTYDGAAMIKNSASSSEITVTVLPVVNPDDNLKNNVVITKLIISGLLESGFIDVVPYRVMIENVWDFYPDFFEVNPSKILANPNNVDFYGNLELVEKQHLAPVIGCDYIVDGIYSSETQKVIVCELFSREENKIVASFTREIVEGTSVMESVKTVCSEIKQYFFEKSSDDFVFQELRKLSAKQGTGKMLKKWESLYPDNLFVAAGMMIYFKKYAYSSKKVVLAGEKWFSVCSENQSKQTRFFQSLNFNPYYILGNEYIKQQKYEKALDVLKTGEKRFPFNSEELKNELILCLRLLGKHEEAELIEQKK